MAPKEEKKQALPSNPETHITQKPISTRRTKPILPDMAPKEEKKQAGYVVFKFSIHCEKCVLEIFKYSRSFPGVEEVKADSGSNKVTVSGKLDPLEFSRYLHTKTKRKVELIYPQPKEKKNQARDVVLKASVNVSEKYVSKIVKCSRSFPGVESVKADPGSNKVAVSGNLDPLKFRDYLEKKTKKKVILHYKKNPNAACIIL